MQLEKVTNNLNASIFSISELPDEILEMILSHLELGDMKSTVLVQWRWSVVTSDAAKHSEASRMFQAFQLTVSQLDVPPPLSATLKVNDFLTTMKQECTSLNALSTYRKKFKKTITITLLNDLSPTEVKKLTMAFTGKDIYKFSPILELYSHLEEIPGLPPNMQDDTLRRVAAEFAGLHIFKKARAISDTIQIDYKQHWTLSDIAGENGESWTF